MKRGLKGLILPVVVIALCIFSECVDSPWKDELLERAGCSLYKSAFIISKINSEQIFSKIAVGDKLYFESQEGEKQAHNQLIYMENQKDKGEEESDPVEDENAAVTTELLSSNDGSAVVGENLKQVPVMNNMGAGTAAYVTRLRENLDVKYLWNHFYIVDSTTSVTRKLFPVENMLKRNMRLGQENGKKQVLIYHTHGASEAFKNSKKGREEDSIVGVGSALAEEIEKNGYGVYHDKTKYDWINGSIDRSRAYNASLDGVTKILKENPDIQVIIDLHRDSVGKNKQTYTMIDGRKTAIIMFFNGMSRSRSKKIDYLHNPNLEANLSFSLQLKCRAMELYEGFTKPIYLKGYRYNLHLKERSLLIELGNENNTVEEAKNAAIPLAKVIADVLKGDVTSN